MKRLHLFLFALGLGFLAILIGKIGAQELWQQLTLVGWGLVPIIIAEGVAEFFHAISWRYCLSGAHRSIPLMRLFRIHLAGYAVNFLTPTASLAGEVTKAALLANNRKGPEAVTAVLIGKLSFALAHLTLVIGGSIFLLPRLHLQPALWTALLVSSALLTVGIFTFFLLQKHGKLGTVVQWLAARKSNSGALQKVVRPLNQIDDTLKHFYRERPRDLLLATWWHLVGYSVGILPTWYFLYLVVPNPQFNLAASIYFLALWFDLVTFAVPLSLGVLEGGRIVAFRAFGFSALPGMTFGIVTRMAQLCWAGVGLTSYAMLIAQPRAHPQTNPSNETDFESPDAPPREHTSERFRIERQGPTTIKTSILGDHTL